MSDTYKLPVVYNQPPARLSAFRAQTDLTNVFTQDMVMERRTRLHRKLYANLVEAWISFSSDRSSDIPHPLTPLRHAHNALLLGSVDLQRAVKKATHFRKLELLRELQAMFVFIREFNTVMKDLGFIPERFDDRADTLFEKVKDLFLKTEKKLNRLAP